MDSFGAVPKAFRPNTATFTGFSAAAAESWQTFRKPIGAKFVSFFLLAGGGNGGTGVIGAAASAAGGGGGGSSGQTIATIPAVLLPDDICLSIGVNTVASYVSAFPTANANHTIAIANAGGTGGNGSGATGGAGGTAGTIATAATMPIGWMFAIALAGQAGIAGGSGAGPALTLPTTGLRVTGATGGGGVPVSGNGTDGGSFTIPSQPTFFPANAGGIGGTGTTTPPTSGNHGTNVRETGSYWYGGTGGGSTHSTASGAGKVQVTGGNGNVGCGGGGMGGAITGSTAAASVALGGPGLCVITWW